MERDDLYVGKRVLYRFTPRGGYGYTVRIPVTVLGVSGSRARVRVERNGDEITVQIGSLIDTGMRGVVAHVEDANERTPL